ncbi:MAG: MerC domain-containing protein [Proteobacteria bacterium]|nr:MerC domain-containing protein [Pseudomonadota bacterium]MBI3498593.1 MerC domain-containing protein [Pseudomonadota bacterium]
MIASTTEHPTSGFSKRNLDKIGVGGSVFAALCCLGFPALISVLSAIGLAFILRDAVLIPLLLVFLAVTLYGLYLGIRHHHEPWALILGGVSAAVTFGFIGIAPNGALAGVGIAGLVVASLLNVWLRTRQLRAG